MAEWSLLLQLAVAFGVGGIFVKILDLIFLQPQTARREYWNWLRDRRLNTYSELIDVLTWEAKKGGKLGLPYSEIKGKAIRASILVEDKMLQNLIELCIAEISSANDYLKESKDLENFEKYLEESTNAREHARQIIGRLKRDLLTPPPTAISIFWIRIKNRLWKIWKRTKKSG